MVMNYVKEFDKYIMNCNVFVEEFNEKVNYDSNT